MLSNRGYATVATLLLLFLATLFLGALVLRQAQAATAARARSALNLNQTRIQASDTRTETLLASLTPVLRAALERAMAQNGWAYGNTPTQIARALAPVLATAQYEADRQVCTEGGIRIYFTPTACRVPLPADRPLPPPRLVSGLADGLQIYEIPYQVQLYSALGTAGREFQAARWVDGVLRVTVGGGTYSGFALVMGSGFLPDGSPSTLNGGEVYEGPVWIPGVANFGISYGGSGRGPVFLSSVMVGLCSSFSPSAGCSARGNPGFAGVGAVSPQDMYPSSLAPCYTTSCPEFGGGVDWGGLQMEPSFNPPASPAVQLKGDQDVLLTPDQLADGTPITQITLSGSPTRLGVDAEGRTWVLADAGANLLEWATATPAAWILFARVEGDAVVVYNRDAYYGEAFPVSGGMSFLISFEVDTTAARWPVGVGFRYYWRGSWDNWCSTRWRCDRGEVIDIPPGQPRRAYETVLTLPADASLAQVFLNIADDPAWSGNTGEARFYNLRVVPLERGVALPLWSSPYSTPHRATPQPPVVWTDGWLNLRGAGDDVASIARDTALTLGAGRGIRLLSSILYQQPPCQNGPGINADGEVTASQCPAYSPERRVDQAVLGLYTPGRFVLGADSADNLRLTAAVAANIVTYERLTPAGTFYLQGSLAAFNYGGFGRLDGTAGWRFSLTHDPRFRHGVQGRHLAPPGFPALPRRVYGVSFLVTRRND